MVFIYHGDHQVDSCTAFNQHLSQITGAEILRLDHKETNPNQITNFFNTPSLFSTDKVLAISNFFSLPKATQDKISKLITDKTNLVLWQDKTLTVTQLKTFPQAKVQIFRLPNLLYTCLNSIKPHNLQIFLPLFQKVIDHQLLDLFLYLLKGQLRRQLSTYSKFSTHQLRSTYLQLIELEYQYKSGELPPPREVALQQLIATLLR